jgi:hypothetical protein
MIPTSLSGCRPGSFEGAWLAAEFADRLDHAADTTRSTPR